MNYYTGIGNAQNQERATSLFYSVGQWYHYVVTYDGTNSTLYVNGENIFTTTSINAPDTWSPLAIGAGKWSSTGGIRWFHGNEDEVAVYTNVLTPNRISAHYNAGIDPADYGAYQTNVLADQPLLYYRMDCAGYTNTPVSECPMAVNFGSAPVNGAYLSGIVPGGVGGPPNVALGTNSVAAPINGLISCVDAGNDPTFNPTGTQSFTAMTWFKTYPSDGRVQAIMSHGANWALLLDGTTGDIIWTNGAGSVTSTTILNDGNWHFVAAVYDGSYNYLYVDGQLNNSASASGSIASDTNDDVFLGGNAAYTQVGGTQLYFAGALAQAAFYTNALGATQIQQIYSAAVPVTLNTNPTNIVFSMTGNQLTLSWPSDHTGWTLQVQTNSLSVGISTNWFDVKGSTNVDQMIIPINLTNGSVFYRLVYP
ncbi:MAG: LamG domain-containing protein, partial [Limisphaerales bacterium]